MLNLLIALALGALMFVLVTLWLSPVAAVIPALGVVLLSMFLLARRVSQRVDVEMQQLVPLLQARRIDEAQALLDGIRQRYSRWQLFLDGQIEAQKGMIDYVQMKWDQALPRLQRGTFRNWVALGCIACIHYRKGRKDEAWKAFEKAVSTASKEAILYAVWAHLLVREGERQEALRVIGKGLQAVPQSELLKGLQKRVANKKKIDPKTFPDTYYQFWPEELAKQAVMRGRKGALPPEQVLQQPRIGARALRRR